MARRYSGNVRISVRWDDSEQVYRCGVTWAENRGTQWEKRRCARVKVGNAASETRAVNDPSCVDDVAFAPSVRAEMGET